MQLDADLFVILGVNIALRRGTRYVIFGAGGDQQAQQLVMSRPLGMVIAAVREFRCDAEEVVGDMLNQVAVELREVFPLAAEVDLL